MPDPISTMRATLVRWSEHVAVEQTATVFHASERAVLRAATQHLSPHAMRVPPGMHSEGVHQRVRGAQAEVMEAVQGTLESTLRDVRVEALRATSRYLAHYEPTVRSGLDHPGVLPQLVQRATRGQRGTLQQLVSDHTQQLRARVDREWSAGVLNGRPLRDFLFNIEDALAQHDYALGRVARTETAQAFNAMLYEITRVLRAQFPDLLKRWTEHVSDTTGMPMDARVGDDSMALHGQLAAVNGMFVMPDDPRIPRLMVGKAFLHPPNRPFDRAIVLPWRAVWGIPGWTVVNGERVAPTAMRR